MNAVAMPSPGKPCVLCIDDEPHILRSLKWLLDKDFEVHVTDSPLQALRMLKLCDFDVVVSDQRMPGITGVVFLRHVRRLAPRAMRILLTGYSDLDAMVRSVNESEVYRFVTKPWDVKELPRVIAEAAEVARGVPPASIVETDVEMVEPPSGPTTAANDATPPPMADQALLVIDDQAELHRQVDQALQGRMEVLHAYDLATALRLLDSKPCAVVLSEVKVGGVDATRLVKMLKATRPEIVTLVVSGQNDAQTVMSLINQGQVYRIVPKPVRGGFVRVLADSALRRHLQLLESPSVRRRFAVEPAGAAAAETLYKDIMAAAATPAPASHSRAAQAGSVLANSGAEAHSLVESLKSGFRRLFGH
jgi:DNA-binding NtrC family response regulator